MRQLSFNLKDPNNPDLRMRVLAGLIPPERLVTMSGDELASDARREENERLREQAKWEVVRNNTQTASTDQFQCGKCKQRKCTYYQMQTRSADEPMTTFVTCTNCGNKWKVRCEGEGAWGAQQNTLNPIVGRWLGVSSMAVGVAVGCVG